MQAAGYTAVEGGGVIPGAGTAAFSASAVPSGAPWPPPDAHYPPPPDAVIRAGSAPQIAGMRTESTYLISAERLARDDGCIPPAAAMTAKGAGQESFVVACPSGATLAVQCGVEGCRILR